MDKEERDTGGHARIDFKEEKDGQKEEEKEYIKDEELTQLIAAAEDAATR